MEVVDSFGAGLATYPSDPSVSVVVATRNRAAFLPDLLEALAGQTMDTSRFEIVVVDDGSTDDTWSALEALADATTLQLRGLRLGRSIGQGPARNVGVQAARGEIVAFTDDDCIPSAIVAQRPDGTAPRRRNPTPCRRAGPDRGVARRRPPWPLGADGLGAPSQLALRDVQRRLPPS